MEKNNSFEVTTGRVNPPGIVQELKSKADRDPAFKAVFTKFGARQRSRNQVTIRALMLSMQKDGFNFPLTKYQEILKFLSELDIGTLSVDRKGQIRALVNVRLTLQSIGQAVIEKSDLKPFKQAYRYRKLDASTPVAKVPAKPSAEPDKTYRTELKITVDGNTMTYPGATVSPEDLGNFLINFSRLNKRAKK